MVDWQGYNWVLIFHFLTPSPQKGHSCVIPRRIESSSIKSVQGSKTSYKLYFTHLVWGHLGDVNRDKVGAMCSRFSILHDHVEIPFHIRKRHGRYNSAANRSPSGGGKAGEGTERNVY